MKCRWSKKFSADTLKHIDAKQIVEIVSMVSSTIAQTMANLSKF